MRKGTTIRLKMRHFGLPYNLCVRKMTAREERQDVEYGSGNRGTRRRCQKCFFFFTFFLHLLINIFDQTVCTTGKPLQPQPQPSSTTRCFLDASNSPTTTQHSTATNHIFCSILYFKLRLVIPSITIHGLVHATHRGGSHPQDLHYQSPIVTGGPLTS